MFKCLNMSNPLKETTRLLLRQKNIHRDLSGLGRATSAEEARGVSLIAFSFNV